MEYVEHPLIRAKEITLRKYQENSVAASYDKSALIVLPTGLGKTIIALMVAAHKLKETPGKKILFLAPTKPLVVQHYETFKKLLLVDEQVFLTGQTPMKDRDRIIAENKVLFSTPQTIENQAIRGLDLSQFSLIIFDEAHKAVGNYSYVAISRQYHEQSDNPQALALTASPGKDREKIRRVCKNLGVKAVEAKTEQDRDVKPYVQRTDIKWVGVELPPGFVKIKKELESILSDKLKLLKSQGYLDSAAISKANKKTLLAAQAGIRKELVAGGGNFTASSIIASAIKISHAIELLETQGLRALNGYFQRVLKQKSKAVKKLSNDYRFQRARALTESLLEKEVEHPKIEALAKTVSGFRGKKVLVFTQYRDSVDAIINRLNEEDLLTHEFIGQQSKGSKKGMSQKKQIEVLERFRQGAYTALVATSVAEEGLDIPRVDLVVFYEPVPSEIRAIQRRGRTGRTQSGKVVVLMTKKTRDEAYYWAARHKEKKMSETVKSLKNEGLADQMRLGDYEKPGFNPEGQQHLDAPKEKEEEVKVFVDQRERNTVLLETLRRLCTVDLRNLAVGDFIASERVCIERKSMDDFLQSIIDRRLVSQMKEMRRNFEQPLLILEGHDRYSRRDIHPNAIRGMLASIATGFSIPIIPSEDEADTAHIVYQIAKREQLELDKKVSLRGEKKPLLLSEQQRFIVESLPNVSAVLAHRLLFHFKTVEKIATATKKQLMKVEGVGEKKAQRIRKVLREKYGGE